MISEKNWHIRLSQACDFVPYVSTVTNGITLLFQAAVAKGYCSNAVRNSDFGQYLKSKNKLTCVGLLVPRYGNVAYAVYSLFMFVKNTGKLPTFFAKNNAELDSIKSKLNGYNQDLYNLCNSLQNLKQRLVEDPNGDPVERLANIVERFQRFLEKVSNDISKKSIENAAKEDPFVKEIRDNFNHNLGVFINLGNAACRISGSNQNSERILNSLKEMKL